MTIFEYVSVAFSIIVGLAIARVLSALTDLFIYRERVQFYWVPVVWAIALFALLLINWWQLFAVSEYLAEWTFLDFTLPIMQVIALYVGSSLILPRHWSEERIDLFEFFRTQGRWGIAAYSVFFVLAYPTNIRLWGGSLLSGVSILMAGIIIACVGTVLSRTKLQVNAWTAAFIAIQLGVWGYVIFPALGN